MAIRKSRGLSAVPSTVTKGLRSLPASEETLGYAQSFQLPGSNCSKEAARGSTKVLNELAPEQCDCQAPPLPRRRPQSTSDAREMSALTLCKKDRSEWHQGPTRCLPPPYWTVYAAYFRELDPTRFERRLGWLELQFPRKPSTSEKEELLRQLDLQAYEAVRVGERLGHLRGLYSLTSLERRAIDMLRRRGASESASERNEQQNLTRPAQSRGMIMSTGDSP